MGFPDTLTDRYGDVLGTRKRRFSDFVRDAAIAGSNLNDSAAVMKMHQQVADNFAKAMDRQREIAEEEEGKRRQNNQAIFDIFAVARKTQNPARAAKTMAKEFGIELSDEVTAILADDKQIQTADFDRIADALEDGGDLTKIFANTQEGLQRIQSFVDLKAKSAGISKSFADLKRTQAQTEKAEFELGIKKNKTPFQNAMDDAVEEIMANPKAFQERDPGTLELRPLDPKQIRRTARQLVRIRGIEPEPGENVQDPGVAEAVTGKPTDLGLPQSGSTTTTATSRPGVSTTSTPTTGGRGLAQTRQANRGLPQQNVRRTSSGNTARRVQ
jgi:hypothetical protein